MSAYADLAAPMLVKEIRQDLRTRGFTGVFIWYHAALILSMVVMLASQGNVAGASSEEGVFFWFVVALPALMLIPFRGFLSFNKETKGGALELLFLTRLTAWQVVFGKWASLSLQAMLFLTAALPYAFLRFFLGSVSISESLLVFVGMMMGAMLCSAATVGISALGAAKEERMAGFFVGVIAFGPPTIQVGVWFTYFAFSRTGSALIGVALLLVYGALGVLVMLEVAAWRIAPPSENHAFRLRVIGLALMAITAVFCLLSSTAIPASLGCAAALMLPIFLTSLCEAPRFLLGIFDPFVHGGRIRYRTRWLFYPGWVSGVAYVVVSTFLFCILVRIAVAHDSWPIIYVAVFSLGIIIFPLSMVLIVKQSFNSLFRAYALAQLAISVSTLFIVIIKAATRVNGLDVILKLIPHSAVFFVFDSPKNYYGPKLTLLAGLVVVAGSLLLLAMRAAPIFTLTRAAERSARALSAAQRGGDAGEPEVHGS